MANHLEQLVAEWYEYRGYLIQRNVRVGPRRNGGHECELDVIAFNPRTQHLVQIEPSADTNKQSVRESRYRKKFDAGKKYIPSLFAGLTIPTDIEQIGVFLYGASKPGIAGGRMMLVSELLAEIMTALKGVSISKKAVSENFPLLRTLQLASEFRNNITPIWSAPPQPRGKKPRP